MGAHSLKPFNLCGFCDGFVPFLQLITVIKSFHRGQSTITSARFSQLKVYILYHLENK